MKIADTKQDPCVRLPAKSLKLDFFPTSRTSATPSTRWVISSGESQGSPAKQHPRVQPPC